jgi:hypothetical protein
MLLSQVQIQQSKSHYHPIHHKPLGPLILRVLVLYQEVLRWSVWSNTQQQTEFHSNRLKVIVCHRHNAKQVEASKYFIRHVCTICPLDMIETLATPNCLLYDHVPIWHADALDIH